MKNIKPYFSKWVAITVFFLGFVYLPFQMAMPLKDDLKELSIEKKLLLKKNKEVIILCLAVIPKEAYILQYPNQRQEILEYCELCEQEDFFNKEIHKLSEELKELTVEDIKYYLIEHIKNYLTGSDKDFLSECENRMGPRLYATKNNLTMEEYFQNLIDEYRNKTLQQTDFEKHIQDFIQASTLNKENSGLMIKYIHDLVDADHTDFSSLKSSFLKIILHRAHNICIEINTCYSAMAIPPLRDEDNFYFLYNLAYLNSTPLKEETIDLLNRKHPGIFKEVNNEDLNEIMNTGFRIQQVFDTNPIKYQPIAKYIYQNGSDQSSPQSMVMKYGEYKDDYYKISTNIEGTESIDVFSDFYEYEKKTKSLISQLKGVVFDNSMSSDDKVISLKNIFSLPQNN